MIKWRLHLVIFLCYITYFKTFGFEKVCLSSLVESGNVHSFIKQFPKNDAEGRNPILSPLEEFKDDLDLSVDPCDDFFKFSCGGFIKRVGNPPANGFTTPLDSYNRTAAALSQVTPVLELPVSKHDNRPLQQAKKLYMSCMGEQAIEERGLGPLLKYLADLGGWPVLGHWNDQHFDLINLLARVRPLIKNWAFHYQPSGVIIGTIIQRDFRAKGQYVIYMDQANLGQFNFYNLPNQEVYRLGVDNFFNKVYEQYLIDLAVLLGAEVKTAIKDMRKVLELEIKLANAMLYEEERRPILNRYEKLSIFELHLKYPKIDWLRYLRKVLSIANVSVGFHTKVVLYAAPYYDKLTEILSETSDRTLANYILFRAIHALLPSLNEDIRYVHLRYMATVNGDINPRLPSRAPFCTDVVAQQLSLVTSRIYIETSRNDQIIDYVTMINGYTRSEFIRQINMADWLSPRSKDIALKKMEKIHIDIGYPKEIYKDKLLEDYYKNFDFKDSFFENMENALIENYKIALSQLVRFPETEWLIRITDAGAVHNINTANIEIPYAVMGVPMFDISFPPSLNFGGLGFLLGHEYGHGFEITGIAFDWNGQIGNFWSKQSLKNFYEKEACYINQYSKYFLPDAGVYGNGSKTVNENICDNLGVKAAFYAYQNFKRDKRFTDEIPGLPYTGDQLLFINAARVWCSSDSVTFLRKFAYIDHHAFNRLRVIGPLQNSREFADAFHCPVGSYMNPVKKCDFW